MKKRILVIRFGSLGDVLLTSAPLVNLRISFPEHEIDFLTKTKFAPIVRLFGTVNNVITIPEHAGLMEVRRTVGRLGSYELVIDLHGNLRSLVARLSTKSCQHLIYPKRRRYRMKLTRRRKKIPEQFPHTIDLYNDAVRRAGGRIFMHRPLLKLSRNDELSELLLRLDGDDPVVVVAPGAAHPTKQWRVELFAEVAALAHRKRDAVIVWAGLESDRTWPEFRSIFAPDKLIELIDLPVEQLAHVIAEADVTISNDSGIAHLSSAVGTPVVALFGPTHPALGFAPRGLKDTVVEVDEPCRPCSLHGQKSCYRDQRYCLDRITPEMVTRQVARILKDRSGSTRALFVDRDGTLIVDKHFLSDPNEIEFIDGSVDALRKAKQLGFRIVVISNQSGVARGLFDTSAVEKVNTRLVEMLAAQGVEIDAVYYCPHYADGEVAEFARECNCRKPAAGMIEEAAMQLGIDLRKSWVVGDKTDDLFLTFTSPVSSILVRTGKGDGMEPLLRAFCFEKESRVADNLSAAVELIDRECRDE